jgi:hypothetical protein
VCRLIRIVSAIGALVLAAYGANPNPRPLPQDKKAASDPTSIVIIFKDGHEETFAMSDIARVEYRDAEGPAVGPEKFLGTWEVGDGNSGTFLITFEPNGQATRSLGASHGIWTIVNEEARISWDDGWHDVIRKAGDRHEKFAFEPGASITDDKPANVTDARKLKGKKIKTKTNKK